MKDGTGEGYTHADHPDLANQLYAAYARAVHVRVLASVVGREGLTDTDQLFLNFGDMFEKEFVHQEHERSLEDGMEIGWRLLRTLPISELIRLNDRQIELYINQDAEVERYRMTGPGQAPTNAAVLELKNEQVVVKEAYTFLDEKRLLLASELLRQLGLYQNLNKQLNALHAEAKDAIQSAVMHHGLNGLQVYPTASLDGAGLTQTSAQLHGRYAG